MVDLASSERASSLGAAGTAAGARSLAKSVGFELLGPLLGGDVESALNDALRAGVVFSAGTGAIAIFQETLSASIRGIESHPRGVLFQEFLSKGPYEDVGEIPPALVDRRLSDSLTAEAIRFIYAFMVNCFKGAIAELLAARACSRLIGRLQHAGELPASSRMFFGDSVAIHSSQGERLQKGADLHVLSTPAGWRARETTGVTVAGVVEVKSHHPSEDRVQRQLENHVRRTKKGMRVQGVDFSREAIVVGYGSDRRVLRVSVVPSRWVLPRTFWFENAEGGRSLRIENVGPPTEEDTFTQTGDNEWKITLKWSVEALAEAAHEMTFWYMGKVGEIIYSLSMPKGWEGMTPSEAGRNAVKMMLYYSILRARTSREEQRAIALYNSYGFGYSIGTNFVNSQGKREMLWPQDLDEILSRGETGEGCHLRGSGKP